MEFDFTPLYWVAFLVVLVAFMAGFVVGVWLG
jgi:hypothetical protein